MKTMNTETVLSVAKVIAERTDDNDHNQALICASVLLDNLTNSGETNRTKILKHVREIHHLIGHMPSGLMEIREEYRPKIMTHLEKNLSATEYKAIYDSL